MNLDLQITNEGRYPLDEKRLFGVVEGVLKSQQTNRRFDDASVEVSLLVTGKEKMAEFNLKYHQTEGPTDVLSFPYTDPQSQTSSELFVTPPDTGIILGDVIVCFPVAEENAKKEGKTTQEMIEFYLDHGLHHLLGHHHD